MHIIGDVGNRRCIVVDDIVDGTLCNAATALMDAGARSVGAYVTHGVLSGGEVARVSASPLDELLMTESIGKPPFRSRRRTGSGRMGGRPKALTMSRRTRGFPPTRPLARRVACAISMGHYQRDLV